MVQNGGPETFGGGSQGRHRRASNRKRSIRTSALQEAPAAKVTTAASVREEQPVTFKNGKIFGLEK